MNAPKLLPRPWFRLTGEGTLHRCLGCYVALAMYTLIPLAIGRAENWPSFRGPEGTSVSIETNAPLKWGGNENILWRARLPDRGNSAPVVWGARIFVTQAIKQDSRRTVLCFDRRDGNMLWQAGITNLGSPMWLKMAS